MDIYVDVTIYKSYIITIAQKHIHRKYVNKNV